MTDVGVMSLLDDVSRVVGGAIEQALPEQTGADPVVRRSDRADFQSNAALALARRARRKPGELAADVAAELPGPRTLLHSVEVSGPGFLNLTLLDTALWDQVTARVSSDRLGVRRSERGRRTVIDYSAPNIAKEMHVGHLRTTVIGDSITRVLDFLGADVVRQNHVGDWGTQFGMLIQYLDEHPDATWRGADLGGSGSAVSALDELYRAARSRFDADASFADRARSRVVALQAGDSGTVARWREIVSESEKSFRSIYDRLGVLLTAEDSVGESFYNPRLASTVADLVAAGIAVQSDGALVIASTTETGPDDQPVVLMIRKSDGGYGYGTTDMATIRYRIEQLGAQRLIYVTDSRQAMHFRLVFDAARRAGWLTDDIVVQHAAYGTVLGPDGRPFKTRSGGTVKLMDLLDAAVDRARDVVREKNPGIDEAELDRTAESAGIGSVKYADLSTSRVKDYMFDLDRMVSFTGNTGVYLQYAHARIASILRKAGRTNSVDIDRHVRVEPAERALILQLDGFEAVLLEVAELVEPHRLCGYLYDLAKAFTAFYEACPVLNAVQRDNRIALCRLTARTLATGLYLLGIVAPDRM